MAVSPMASVLVKLSTSALGIGFLLVWRLPRGTGGSAGCLFWLMMSCCASRVLLYMVGLPPVRLRCQMLMYAWVMFSWAHVPSVLRCLHRTHLILLLKYHASYALCTPVSAQHDEHKGTLPPCHNHDCVCKHILMYTLPLKKVSHGKIWASALCEHCSLGHAMWCTCTASCKSKACWLHAQLAERG